MLQNQLSKNKLVLQISGGKLHYKRKCKTKLWVLDRFEVLCGNETYCDIEDDKVYTVTLNSYLSTGGSGWTFPNHSLTKEIGNFSYFSLQNYIENHSPINQKIENRITFTYELEPEDDIEAIKYFALFAIFVILFLLVIIGLRICQTKPKAHKVDVAYHRLNR